MAGSTASPKVTPGSPVATVKVVTLRLRRIEPWEAMKTGFLFATGLAVIWLIAGGLLFGFAQLAGVFDSFNTTVSDISGQTGAFDFSLLSFLAVSAVFAVIEVVALSVLFGVLAMLYNAVAAITGGLKLKFADG